MITLQGITLPADLNWADEPSHTPIRSAVEKSLGGAPIIWEDEGDSSGRFIDLTGDEESAWISRSTYEALVSLASTPLIIYTLDYHGTTYNVRFRNEEKPPVFATPVVQYSQYDGTDWYSSVQIKLMEI